MFYPGFIRKGADIAKLAVMPHSLDDVLRLLDVTLHSSGQVCTIAMEEIGKHSRVMAPIYGYVMTYGYIDIPVAPVQLRVDELKNALRILLPPAQVILSVSRQSSAMSV